MKWLNILILVAGAILSVPSPGDSQEVFEEERGLFSTRQLESNVAIGTEKKVVIRSASTLQGTIQITTGAENTVSVSYVKKSRADSRSKAIDYIDLIAVRLDHNFQGVRLELRAPNPAPWTDLETGLVEAEMVVPESCVVEVDAPYFNVSAKGPFQTFTVSSSLGRLDIGNVVEQLNVKTANRRLSIEKISGDISAGTTNSLLAAKEISSTRKQARFQNDGGGIEINGFVGEISVRNSYGRIELTNFEPGPGRSFIRSFSSPIIIGITRIAEGQVIISNRFEDIEIVLPAHFSARLSLSVEEGGKIETSGFQFKTDLVRPNRLNLVTGDGKALIIASVRGKGNIYIRAEEEGD